MWYRADPLAPHRAGVRGGDPALAPHRAAVRGGDPATAPQRGCRVGDPALSRPENRGRRLVVTSTPSADTVRSRCVSSDSLPGRSARTPPRRRARWGPRDGTPTRLPRWGPRVVAARKNRGRKPVMTSHLSTDTVHS